MLIRLKARKGELRAWAARLEAECAAFQSGGTDSKKGGVEKAVKVRHAAVVTEEGAGPVNVYGNVLPARKRHRSVRMYGRSDFRGVYQSDSNKWMARITVAGRKLTLGAFRTESAAAHAYDGSYFLLVVVLPVYGEKAMPDDYRFLCSIHAGSGFKPILWRQSQAELSQAHS